MPVFFPPDLFLLRQLNGTQVWAQMELLHSIWNEEWVEMEVNAKANAVWKHTCSVRQFDFSSLIRCFDFFSLNQWNFLIIIIILASKLWFNPGFITEMIYSPVSSSPLGLNLMLGSLVTSVAGALACILSCLHPLSVYVCIYIVYYFFNICAAVYLFFFFALKHLCCKEH